MPSLFTRSSLTAISAFLAGAMTLLLAAVAGQAEPLEDGFANPPRGARLRAYWWWLNGNVTGKPSRATWKR